MRAANVDPYGRGRNENGCLDGCCGAANMARLAAMTTASSTPSWTPPSDSQVGATLETFILEGMFQVPGATGTFTALLNQISLTAKLITGRVRSAGLADILGYTGETNVQGETVQKLDVIANETMIASLRRQGHCAA